jgi:hypothetical protein
LHRLTKVGLATVACLALLAAAAFAELPRAGTFEGTSTANDTLTFEVASRHKIDKITIDTYCSEPLKYRDVKVNDRGRFHAKHEIVPGVSSDEIKGKFTTRTQAEGTLYTVFCNGDLRDYTVTRTGG